jgi:peroxiredoxin
VLGAGDRLPDVAVWTTARRRVTLSALAAEGPILLVFYLFDWSST